MPSPLGPWVTGHPLKEAAAGSTIRLLGNAARSV